MTDRLNPCLKNAGDRASLDTYAAQLLEAVDRASRKQDKHYEHIASQLDRLVVRLHEAPPCACNLSPAFLVQSLGGTEDHSVPFRLPTTTSREPSKESACPPSSHIDDGNVVHSANEANSILAHMAGRSVRCRSKETVASQTQTYGYCGGVVHWATGGDAEPKHYGTQSAFLGFSDRSGVTMQQHLHWVVMQWPFFEYIVALVIIANCAVVGVESNREAHSEGWLVLQHMEWVFLVLYLVELFMRFVALGGQAPASAWFRFDCLVMAIGVVYYCVYRPIVASTGGPQYEAVRQVFLLRLVRLARLMRQLRRYPICRSLHHTCTGLLNSISVIFSVSVLVFCTLYVFACVGLHVITKDAILRQDPTTRALVEQHFTDLFTIMLTLAQFASMDSVGQIYFPLIRAKWSLLFYFFPIVLFVYVSIMNVITALLVERALARGAAESRLEMRERAKEARALVPDIRHTFRMLDTNDSGTISRLEAQHCTRNLPRRLMAQINSDDLIELFDLLDVDNTGEITEQEFIDGVLHVALADVPPETQRILKLLHLQGATVARVESSLKDFRDASAALVRTASVGRHGSLKKVMSGDTVHESADGFANGRLATLREAPCYNPAAPSLKYVEL